MTKEIWLTGALFGLLLTLGTAIYSSSPTNFIFIIVSTFSAIAAIFMFKIGITKYFAEIKEDELSRRKILNDNFEKLYEILEESQKNSSNDFKEQLNAMKTLYESSSKTQNQIFEEITKET